MHLRSLFISLFFLHASVASASVTATEEITTPSFVALAAVQPLPGGRFAAWSIAPGMNGVGHIYTLGVTDGWTTASLPIVFESTSGPNYSASSGITSLSITQPGEIHYNYRTSQVSYQGPGYRSTRVDSFRGAGTGDIFWEVSSTSSSNMIGTSQNTWQEFPRRTTLPLRVRRSTHTILPTLVSSLILIDDLEEMTTLAASGFQSLLAGPEFGSEEPVLAGFNGDTLYRVTSDGDALTSIVLGVYTDQDVELVAVAQRHGEMQTVIVEDNTWYLDTHVGTDVTRRSLGSIPSSSPSDFAYVGQNDLGGLLLVAADRGANSSTVTTFAENPDGTFERSEIEFHYPILKFLVHSTPTWEHPAIVLQERDPIRLSCIYWNEREEGWRFTRMENPVPGEDIIWVSAGSNAEHELVVTFSVGARFFQAPVDIRQQDLEESWGLY